MRVIYLKIYKMLGFNKLGEGNNDVEFLEQENLRATLANEPEAYFTYIDQSVAVANTMLNAVFLGANQGSFEERVNLEINRIRAERKKNSACIFLILQGSSETAQPESKCFYDGEEFTVYENAIKKEDIRAKHRPAFNKILRVRT